MSGWPKRAGKCNVCGALKGAENGAWMFGYQVGSTATNLSQLVSSLSRKKLWAMIGAAAEIETLNVLEIWVAWLQEAGNLGRMAPRGRKFGSHGSKRLHLIRFASAVKSKPLSCAPRR
eukprot:174348-Chlamydomonas_euryale.AAC.2